MFGINKKLTKNKPDAINKKSQVSKEVGKSKAVVPDLICKSYVDGCLVLGCVHDVSNSELIVSLPGIGNFGFVKLNNISKTYTDLLKSEAKEQVSPLSAMYNKGNLLRCKVLNYNNKKLNLTIEPVEVNASLTPKNIDEEMIVSGSVKNKEDHGYTIDLGVDDLTGFYRTNDVKLAPGQCCLFKVTSKKSERTISLKLCNSDDETLFYEIKTRTKFDTYLPGAQLTCTVEKVGKNGIQAAISNQINAFVHTNHMPIAKRANFSKKEYKNSSSFTNGDKVTGTIIFINPYSKVIYLSLLPHLTDSTKLAKVASLFLNNDENLKIGQIIENTQITSHTYKGIYVKFMGENEKSISGFIPKRHLFDKNPANGDDEEEDDDDLDDAAKSDKANLKKAKKDPNNMNREELERLFPLNASLRARIYDINLIEDIILLSIRPSVIDASVMAYSELKVGQTIKCTVRSINPINGGVNVKISDFVSGFIPKIHTSDVPLSEVLLPRKMKPGAEIKCRILQLDSEGKRCVLTAKNTLVKTKLPLLDTFDLIQYGMETYGVVVSVQKYGLLLSFFNDLKGLLPRNQISTSLEVLAETTDLKKLFYIGQVTKCRVLEFNREKQQLKLSLIMGDVHLESFKRNKQAISDVEMDTGTAVTAAASRKKTNEKNKPTEAAAAAASTELPEEEYKIGELIESASIVQINEENCYFRVKLPKGSTNGIIYKNHLSDFECLNDILFECYKRSMKMSNAMVTRYSSDVTIAHKSQSETANQHKMCHYLTLKTSLIEHYTQMTDNEIAKSFTDLKANEWYYGWIRKTLTNGVLVEMPHNLIGFASNQELGSSGFSVGQSCLVKVNKLYEDKKQFTTNIRTRHTLLQKYPVESDFMMKLFKSFLVNTKSVFNQLSAYPAVLSATTNSMIHPNSLANKLMWEKAAKKIQIGDVVKIAVKSFNAVTRQLDCLFILDSLTNKLNNDLQGIAFATDDKANYLEGTKLDALVLAFDPLAKVFCLTIDSKQIKICKKNFDPRFRSQLVCKPDQLVKSEIIYVSEWFCIVGLKAHALGRLAVMPLFKNDFTQLNSISAEASLKQSLSTELKIKKQQLIKVSSASISALERHKGAGASQTDSFSKDDKDFSYYCIGQTGKVYIKTNNTNEIEDLDFLIVVHDLSEMKKNKKLLIKQLSVLNESLNDKVTREESSKLNENAEPVLVRKKLVTDNNKRKLTNISNQEESSKDFIEIVADVKTKKQKLDENNSTSEQVAFPWDVTNFDMFNKVVNNLNSGDGVEEELTNIDDSANKKDKKKKNFIDDRKLHQIEENAFDPNRAPDSIEDYERLLVASPNSSFLWIKYIAFYLQMGESDKARSVANKALATINYREESERLNIWIALLNLENLYGSQATVDDTFNKATQNCDSFKVHSHMAEIYANTSKLQEAEDIYIRMTRKFNNLPETWIKYAIFHYKNSNCEAARKILMRSLNSLDKKEHVEIVNKFAQLEFKYGDIERAKTMYDSLLFTYPNRTDIWSVYIDMLIKHQKHDDARHIFNRIIQLGLTAKRMKFIFKKYMDFEKAHGSEDLCQKVKEMAVKYVETNSQTKSLSDDNNNNKQNSIETNLKKNLFIQNE